MQAEERVMLPRGIRELVGIVFGGVKMQVASECSCKLSTPKGHFVLFVESWVKA